MSKLRALWQASVNATKRAVVWNSEDLFPPSERFIFNFNSKDEVKKWHLYSDSEYGESGRINFYTDLLLKELLEDGDMKKKRGGSLGGKKLLSDALKHNPFNDYLSDICIKFICHGSTPFVNCLSSASLEITDGVSGGDTSTTGVFSGNLSLDMSEGSPWMIRRSGFCGMRSKKFDGFIDLDSYDTIAMKLRGDGRCYISTIYTENWVNSPGQEEDNSWQAFVYVPQGSWRILKIPLDSYLPTWKGNVIEDKLEMNPSRVVGMSLSLNAEGGVPGAKTGPGDFRLEVDWIKALRAL